MSGKAVIYVRVSSKEQEREGFSIPAQKKFLTESAVGKGLQVVRVFEEAESAKVAGRTKFKEMLQYLAAHPEVRHLLVEKTDRLYRNLKDYNLLDPEDWPELSIHLVKEHEVLTKESRSTQKLFHGIKVLMAKNYSDNLSEEVQKGMTQKASQGLWPSCAPIGYLNCKSDNNAIEPDPKKAPLIRRAFELASSGQYSLRKLKHLLFTEGLRSRNSKKEVSVSQLQRMLSNPIYHGEFKWKGEVYKGTHRPLIDKILFDKVQIQMGFVKRSKMTKFNFPFTSTMTCAHCGCSITAEEKRKKSGLSYIYYHCTSSKGSCPERVNIREEKITSWIGEALSAIQIPEHIVEWTKKALHESHKDEQAYHLSQLRLQEDHYRTIQNKISKAYADRLDGAIEYDFWRQQNERMNQELIAVESQLASLREANAAYVEKGIQLMELARQASTLFLSMTNDEKREMVNLVLSNPRIENGSLRYDYKKGSSQFVVEC